MAFFWYLAVTRQWRICRAAIYDLPIGDDQIRRELRNSIHAPLHAVILPSSCSSAASGTPARLVRRDRAVHDDLGRDLALCVAPGLSHQAAPLDPRRASPQPSQQLAHRDFLLLHREAGLRSRPPRRAGDHRPLRQPQLLRHRGLVHRLPDHQFLQPRQLRVPAEELQSLGGKVLTTTTYHSLHHSRYTGNYGLGTRVLDRIFGTEWEDYDRLYDRISAERRPLTRLREGRRSAAARRVTTGEERDRHDAPGAAARSGAFFPPLVSRRAAAPLSLQPRQAPSQQSRAHSRGGLSRSRSCSRPARRAWPSSPAPTQ